MAHFDDGTESKACNGDARDRKNEELNQEEDGLALKVEAEVTQELISHMAKIELEIKDVFDKRMAAMANHCSNQAAEVVSTRKMDILHTNKVFRDISRPLGANWRPVFDRLMTDFPPEVVAAERFRIEQDRPVLQPYKALMTWKEARGSDFDVRDLVEALRLSGLEDLAQVTLKILDNTEADSLIELTGFGKDNPNITGTAKAAPVAANPSSHPTASLASAEVVSTEDLLDDRHLLQLAKRLDAKWEALASVLQIPANEIEEVIASEGRTYQGGFKILWNWRESSPVSTTTLESLMEALRRIDCQDIIDQVLQ